MESFVSLMFCIDLVEEYKEIIVICILRFVNMIVKELSDFDGFFFVFF